MIMIQDYLAKGEENARTGKELCRLLGLTARDVSEAVEKARRDGVPICANTGSNPGYYIAATKDDMTRYCRSLWKRAGEIHKTRRACLKTIEDLPDGKQVPSDDGVV